MRVKIQPWAKARCGASDARPITTSMVKPAVLRGFTKILSDRTVTSAEVTKSSLEIGKMPADRRRWAYAQVKPVKVEM